MHRLPRREVEISSRTKGNTARCLRNGPQLLTSCCLRHFSRAVPSYPPLVHGRLRAKIKDVDPAAKPAATSTPYRNQPNRIAKREAAYFEAVCGIEAPGVKAVESGVILRFSYRVVDPEKAKPPSW
jgi:hypothetical protein